jgi:hypothetical protein
LSRPPRAEATTPLRDRLKQESLRAAPLRDQYPRVAEIRVELNFSDRVSPPPSSQTFSYFPAARGYFRYACPCHSCSGEFDISGYVADLAAKPGAQRRSREVNISCVGHRAPDRNESTACPIGAQVLVSIVPHSKDQA